MVRLDRVVHDPEATALAGLKKRALELTDEARRAERGNIAPDLQRQVTRMSRSKRRSLPVRILRVRTTFAAGTFATTAPAGSNAKIEFELSRSP